MTSANECAALFFRNGSDAHGLETGYRRNAAGVELDEREIGRGDNCVEAIQEFLRH
jgi:hypothetical protein